MTSHSAYTQDIYGQTCMDIEGNLIRMQDFKGKRLVFIILSSKEDTLTTSINNFMATHDTSVQVIGILSREDGANEGKRKAIKMLYRSKILLTEPMNTKKGGNQSGLLKWLTNRSQNHHFDMDVKGAGHKFLINRQGVLKAVLSPEVSLNAPIISRILSN